MVIIYQAYCHGVLETYQGHVDLPLPLLAKCNPTLGSIIGDFVSVVKVKDGRRKNS